MAETPGALGDTARRAVAPGLVLCALAFAFGAILGHGFLAWDDEQNVALNARFLPPTLEGLARFWREPFKGLYVPVSYSFFALEARLDLALAPQARGLRLDATVFHAGSLALHAACALLAGGLLRRWTGSRGAAWMGAALFALHPVQVEPVAWITETRGLLASLFALGALSAHAEFSARAGERSARRVAPYAGGLLCLCLALLSKPSAAVVPLLAWIAAVGLLGRPAGRAALELLPWLALAAAAGLATRALQPTSPLDSLTPLASRPLVAGDALCFYLGKLVWPFGLAADYGRTPESVLAGSWARFAWIVPLALALALVGAGRRGRPWLSACALFVAALAPVLGLVPFHYQQFSTVADRYMHLALLGPALALAAGLARTRRRAPWIAACAGLVLCALASRAQVAHWRDDATLFARTLELQPESFPAHVNLGLSHLRAGRLDAALEHLERAAELRPDDVRASLNLAQAYDRAGASERARRQYERSLELAPRMPQAHVNLGEFLLRRGERDAAARCFERALELDGDLSGARNNLALVQLQEGRIDEAVRGLRELVRRDPALPEGQLNLGRALLASGRRDEGLRHLREALRLRPGYADALAVLRSLGETP